MWGVGCGVWGVGLRVEGVGCGVLIDELELMSPWGTELQDESTGLPFTLYALRFTLYGEDLGVMV